MQERGIDVPNDALSYPKCICAEASNPGRDAPTLKFISLRDLPRNERESLGAQRRIVNPCHSHRGFRAV
ncbi:protein of unknown function (plasmid) [Caballeronia sp. S22]